MDLKQKWEDHAKFLSELSAHVADLATSTGLDRLDAIENYTLFLSQSCMEHAEKHCDDAANGSLEHLLSKEGVGVKEYPKDGRWAKCGSDGWKMKDGFTKDGFPRNNEEHVRQMYEAGP
jgi:hypothetical protein